MELSREESKRILRRIELEAYSALVTALRAQGELDRQKKKLLRELGEQLSISTERHRAEIRRAISDDRLSMIAECVCGSDASVEWELEGRRVVPLMPRLVPQTAFTGSATAAANHAASVNSTIPSAAKGRPKSDDEEFKSRKRPRTSSPGIIQKVIVSSAPKTSTSTTTFRNNAQAKDSSRFLKTPTLPMKQENAQLLSKKMTSSGSSTGVSSKPIILGGPKSSSVSVAPSKYVAPLPASCLQAHASVVSGNKNRMNLNIVKSKPKTKFKQLAASVKIKPVSSVHTTTVASSVVQSVAQSLLTAAKVKGNEVVSSASKTVPLSRSTSTITVAPRSSISLTAFKTTIQPKPNPQSTPGTVRTVEGISRQNPTQLGKAVSVSRLSRPLPAILPKTIPPKALSTVSSPGRKLASILPAPAKSTSSTLPNPLIVPVVVSSAATSSPIPIAPSPRPPQPFTAGLTSSVMNKVTTVSVVTGQSADLKRDTQEKSLVSSEIHSPVLLGKSPAGSQNSSPMSSKSLDNMHEREALSPVDEILTLVTSPSSVPFVPSSPVKSKPTTSGEISLECDENLFEDLIKDDETEVKTQALPLAHVPPSVSSQEQGKSGLETRKDVSTLPVLNLKQTLAGSNSTQIGQSLQDVKKNNLENLQMLEETSSSPNKASELVSNAIDLSPLVNELISNYPFDDDKNQFENVDVSNLAQSMTADVDTCDDVGVDIVSDLFVGEFPVLGLGSNRNNVSVPVTSDVGEETSVVKRKETSPGAGQGKILDTDSDIMQEDVMTVPQKGGAADNKDKETKESSTQVKVDTCEKKKQTELESKDVNITQGVEESSDTKMDDFAKSGQNVSFKNNDEVENSTNETCGRALDGHKLLRISDNNAGNFGNNSTSPGQSKDVMLDGTADITSDISQDGTTRNVLAKQALVSSETSFSVNTSLESSFQTQVKKPEDRINPSTRIELERNVKSNKIGSESQVNLEKVSEDKTTSNTTADEAGENYQTNVVTETQPVEEPQDEGRKQENIEDQLSGSEVGSPEGSLVRTSNRKRKAPPPRDLSVHPPGWVRSALQLLQKVSRFRGSSRSKNARIAASWFLKPVETTEAPGYFKVIKNPMDFGTIKTKLEAGEYSAPADFHRDMLLVKSNCCKYNPAGHIVRKDCDEVFQFYEAEYERFVEKLDKIYLPTPKKQKASPV